MERGGNVVEECWEMELGVWGAWGLEEEGVGEIQGVGTWCLELVYDPVDSTGSHTQWNQNCIQNAISEHSSTCPYLFWKQVSLIFACLLVPAKTAGTNALARGQRFCHNFISGFLRLGEHMLAEQMNE